MSLFDFQGTNELVYRPKSRSAVQSERQTDNVSDSNGLDYAKSFMKT